MWKPRSKAIAIAIAFMSLSTLCALPARSAGEVAVVRASSRLMLDTARISDSAAAADSNASQSVYLQILIQNLAYEKIVELLIRNDTAWDTIPCRWVRQADDDFEYWEASKQYGLTNNHTAPRDLEFKLRYVVNKTTYWADNGGKNYLLAKNGGSLLPGNGIAFKNCRWELDTGLNADTSVFTGEADVRGWKAGASMTVVYSPDNLQTQGFFTVKDEPAPTWLGDAPADSDAVRTYKFRVSGIKLPYSKLPVLNFHLKYWDGVKDWRDDNRHNRYAIMLGSKLDDLFYEELPLPAALGRRFEGGNARYPLRSRIQPGWSPVYSAGSRGFFDGMGRSR